MAGYPAIDHLARESGVLFAYTSHQPVRSAS